MWSGWGWHTKRAEVSTSKLYLTLTVLNGNYIYWNGTVKKISNNYELASIQQAKLLGDGEEFCVRTELK